MGKAQDPNEPQTSVRIKDVGPCKKKVTVEIPEALIKQATDAEYQSLQREAVVPGFRKGRAPRRLLEKRFGKETSDQIKLKLLVDASDAAIKDHELNIFGEPDIDHEKVELPNEGPMTFEFEVEVWPEFELPELEGIAVTRTQRQVTDEQVEEELLQLRKYSGMWTPREDGSCEVEDRILADAVIRVEGVEEEEKLDNTDIYVRANGYIGEIPVEKLDEFLVGVAPGEARQLSVEVPKTYYDETYRGKQIDIQVDVKEIKWLKPAELDEGFLGRFNADSEKELRDSIQRMLEDRLETQSRNDMAEQIYTYLLEKTDFELPVDVVAQQASSVFQRQYVRLLNQGLAREKIEQEMEALRAGSESQAQQQVKTFFVIDKVCDKLNIEVTDEEVNGHIAQLAIQRGQRPERLKEQMARDGSLAQFRLEVRQDKCISQLLESATITDAEPSKKATKPSKKKKTTTKKTTKKSTVKTAGKKAAKKAEDA